MKKRVIALGFFDGVHNGHGALMRRTYEVAQQLGAVPSAFTFDPHPQNVIFGRPTPLLTSPEDRADLMRQYYGIEDVIVEPFTVERMKQPWKDFVEQTLVRDLGAVHLVCGHDYHFGYKGEGNPQRLRELCAELGIGCDVIEKVEQEGITVSSTYIRTLVAQGEIERANEFLGHPYTLSDQVSHGKKLGTTLGFPTVNLKLKEHVMAPAKGVYATKVILENGDVLPVWKLFKNTAFSGYHYRRVPAKEESGAEGRNPQAPAEALKAAIAPLATSMSEIVKNKAYSGGWGYDEKTAVVISAEDEISGVELERPFLLLRSQSEVIAALEKTKLGTKDDIDAVVPTVKSQGLISSGGRSYDSIEYEVCVKLTNGVVFTYDAECWFDITSFFGK